MDRTEGVQSLLVPEEISGKLPVGTAPGRKFWQELSEVCCANNGASTNDAKVPQKTLRARLPGQKTTQERPRQLEETTKGLQRTPKSSRNLPQASPKGSRGAPQKGLKTHPKADIPNFPFERPAATNLWGAQNAPNVTNSIFF